MKEVSSWNKRSDKDLVSWRMAILVIHNIPYDIWTFSIQPIIFEFLRQKKNLRIILNEIILISVIQMGKEDSRIKTFQSR